MAFSTPQAPLAVRLVVVAMNLIVAATSGGA